MSLYQMPVEGNEWEQWKARIWNAMSARFYPGLAALEQYMLRSQEEKRCVECGEAGTAKQESVLIKSVSHYYFCDDCDAYWRNKA